MKFALIALSAVGLVSEVFGQEGNYVRVNATGTVHVKPDVATITAYVSEQADAADEATSDFNKKKDNLEQVFNKMEFPDVELVFQGPQLSKTSQSAMAGMAPAIMVAPGVAPAADAPDSVFVMQESVNFKIKLDPEVDSDKLQGLTNNILAGIEKAECSLSNTFRSYNPRSSVVSYSIGDAQQATREARKKAMELARQKALNLAELSNRELGKVISVEEVRSGPVASPTSNPSFSPYYPQPVSAASDRSSTFNKIPVASTLTVKFELK